MGAAALNGFYNLYLKSLNSNITISLSNNPLPRDIDDQVNNSLIIFKIYLLLFNSQIEDAEGEFLGFTISSTSIFGLSFLFASFIIFLVQERDTKVVKLDLTDTYPLILPSLSLPLSSRPNIFNLSVVYRPVLTGLPLLLGI